MPAPEMPKPTGFEPLAGSRSPWEYHAPEPGDHEKYLRLRAKARELAELIEEVCPPCADRSAAIRKVREAVMTANASIALRGAV